jgi:hypothetical protein
MNFSDKKIEPFVFGRQGIFLSKEDSIRTLRLNSYYFFVASIILVVGFIIIVISERDISNFSLLILFFGLFYSIVGYSIRFLKSRIASLLALISFGSLILIRLLEKDIGGLFFISLIFLAASIRSVKASFYYHKID